MKVPESSVNVPLKSEQTPYKGVAEAISVLGFGSLSRDVLLSAYSSLAFHSDCFSQAGISANMWQVLLLTALLRRLVLAHHKLASLNRQHKSA